ncbi:hypothetical protein ID866_8052 [Astraeus odoratus]|nr:hypothetical protein ID866_8052 [Astraeus odoratus]
MDSAQASTLIPFEGPDSRAGMTQCGSTSLRSIQRSRSTF